MILFFYCILLDSCHLSYTSDFNNNFICAAQKKMFFKIEPKI